MWKKASADGVVRYIDCGATLRFALLRFASRFARFPRYAGDAKTVRTGLLKLHYSCSALSAAKCTKWLEFIHGLPKKEFGPLPHPSLSDHMTWG